MGKALGKVFAILLYMFAGVAIGTIVWGLLVHKGVAPDFFTMSLPVGSEAPSQWITADFMSLSVAFRVDLNWGTLLGLIGGILFSQRK